MRRFGGPLAIICAALALVVTATTLDLVGSYCLNEATYSSTRREFRLPSKPMECRARSPVVQLQVPVVATRVRVYEWDRFRNRPAILTATEAIGAAVVVMELTTGDTAWRILTEFFDWVFH